jgi:hypothetical protein
MKNESGPGRFSGLKKRPGLRNNTERQLQHNAAALLRALETVASHCIGPECPLRRRAENYLRTAAGLGDRQ